MVCQSGVGFLIQCILDHAQHFLVDFLRFQPVDVWKISTRVSVHLNKHENPYYIFRDLFHSFCSNKSTELNLFSSPLRLFSGFFVQKLLRPYFGFNWTFFCYDSLISHQKSLKDQKRPTKVIKAIVKAGGSEWEKLMIFSSF